MVCLPGYEICLEGDEDTLDLNPVQCVILVVPENGTLGAVAKPVV